MEWSFPGKCTSGCPLRLTRHTITNRFALYGKKHLSIQDSETEQQARATFEKIALFAGLNSKIDQLDYEKDFYPAVMDALFRCNSWIAMVMITDLLARKYRFNVPGTKANLNWTRRIQRSIAKLRSSRKERKRMQLIRELLGKRGVIPGARALAHMAPRHATSLDQRSFCESISEAAEVHALPGGLRALLDRRADFVAPLRPRTIVVPDVIQA